VTQMTVEDLLEECEVRNEMISVQSLWGTHGGVQGVWQGREGASGEVGERSEKKGLNLPRTSSKNTRTGTS